MGCTFHVIQKGKIQLVNFHRQHLFGKQSLFGACFKRADSYFLFFYQNIMLGAVHILRQPPEGGGMTNADHC